MSTGLTVCDAPGCGNRKYLQIGPNWQYVGTGRSGLDQLLLCPGHWWDLERGKLPVRVRYEWVGDPLPKLEADDWHDRETDTTTEMRNELLKTRIAQYHRERRGRR